MNKKSIYVKCPRCELNYINKKEKLCNICKAELNQPTSFYNTDSESDDSLSELCPVCKANYISLDDDMCEKCKKTRETDGAATEKEDKDWQVFLDDEPAEDLISSNDDIEDISLSQLEEEELAKDFEEEEEEEDEMYDGVDELEADFDYGEKDDK
jgi:hypothetical protein